MARVQDSDTEVQALEAIANLVTSNAEENQTIATLTATNSSIVAELVQVRSEFTAFRKSSRTLNKHYCWICVTHCDHDIKTYRVKKSGHKDEATWKNRLGGNDNKFKPKS